MSVRPAPGRRATAQSSRLERALRTAVRGEVAFDVAHRAMYSTDASNYRAVPTAVVFPRDADDVRAAIAVCRDHRAAILPRGAGTSIAGQACNEAVILDFTRHMRRVIDVDPERRLARVQPGVVLDDLQAAAAVHGLRFGPDPSTHSRCTLGGMIGNNACGAHSIAWGKTIDGVEALEVVLADGTGFTAAEIPGEDEPDPRVRAIGRSLRNLVEVHGEAIRSGYPSLPRRVSGYNLEELLPERGGHLGRALVGTEGTCATVVEATVRLVDRPGASALVVLGYDDLAAAADDAPRIRELGPLAVEGFGRALLDAIPAAHPSRRAVALLPEGGGWLLVEVSAEGSSIAATSDRIAEIARGARSWRRLPEREEGDVWRLREDGAGFASRLAGGVEAWSGWEDAAVPPRHLGAYLREFEALMARHGRRGAAYGHFGDGCVHVRIDFELGTAEGIRGYRRFLGDAADLVVAFGGSLSGEHGDGRSRAELLRRMYPAPLLAAFAAFRRIFDPDGLMNPGISDPSTPLDAGLRLAGAGVGPPIQPTLAYPEDGGSLSKALRRCVGVGRCLAMEGGVMCPSYRVTREEQHSTRGRARALFEMARGDLITDGWRSDEVLEVLDLCLGCKACRSECPVGVDVAAYKAEFLSHHYEGRRRPASHYAMGRLPTWTRLASAAAPVAHVLSRSRTLGRVVKRFGGIARERDLPTFARRTFLQEVRGRAPSASTAGPAAVLWPDTFTNHFAPGIAHDAVAVLGAAGIRVRVPPPGLCCGLPLISTGQLDRARAEAGRTLDALAPQLERGLPVVVLEPSCAAVFRDDLPRLVPGHPAAALAAGRTLTFAEALQRLAPGWRPPPLPAAALVQVHCHQAAVLGTDSDLRLMRATGMDVTVLDSGCCGLAGNFGFERGHHEVSIACAERVMAPVIRAAPEDRLVLADGFSCRTQIQHTTGRRALHLAEALATALGTSRRPASGSPRRERRLP